MRTGRTLGVGLIGLGYASGFHLPAVLGLPGLRLVGVSDRDPARLAAVARRHSVVAAPDYRALLERPDIVSAPV